MSAGFFLLLALAGMVTLSLLVGLALAFHLAPGSGEETEAERKERELFRRRRAEREAEVAEALGDAAPAPRPPSRRLLARELIADQQRLIDLAEEVRAGRALSREEAEGVRDGLLVHLASAGGIKLTGAKGEPLIRHGQALPQSILETHDQGRSLYCELKGLGTRYDFVLRLGLQRESNVHLRLRRASDVPAVEQAWSKDFSSTDPAFDAAFWLEGRGYASLQPLQEQPVAREGVQKIFEVPGVRQLSIKRGLLRLEGELDAETEQAALIGLLAGLRRMAAIYEGEAVSPSLFEARITERSAGSTCPYCRDTFDDELEVLVCEGCATALHGECHAENQGCPVLGCGSRETRARQTA